MLICVSHAMHKQCAGHMATTMTQHLRTVDSPEQAIIETMQDAYRLKPGYTIVQTLWMRCDGDEAGTGGAIPSSGD